MAQKRQVRGLLPELHKKLNVEEAERARDKVQETYTAQRQTRAASKPLVVGQKVWLQDQQSKKWTIGGVIKSVRNGGRSYVVETASGAAYLRNRRFIKQALERVEVARRAGAATNRERIKKEKDKKRVSFKEAVYIVCFQ